jgi:hypothetical protein
MDGELSWHNALFRAGFPDQTLCQSRAFPVGHQIADDEATKNINNNIEIKVGPFGRSQEFGDIPGPDLVRPGSQEFRLLIRGMAQLIPTLFYLALLAQQAIHGAGRAEIPPLVQLR